jgi:hypothetical protein
MDTNTDMGMSTDGGRDTDMDMDLDDTTNWSITAELFSVTHHHHHAPAP